MAPDALLTFMNRYYKVLFEPVHAHAGVVSDVIGDAMLAVWTAPESDINLRARACHAALEIERNVDRFNAGNATPLPTRIGLHAGILAVGDLGAMDHFEYRAVGDIVNTASRIEGVNKTLNTRILVSEAVMEGTTEFVTRELGVFRLVGKQKPVALHELLGRIGESDPTEERLLQEFAAGMVSYRNEEWQQAVAIFENVLKLSPADGPAGFYLDLCKRYALDPPELWEPVVYLKQK